MVWVLDVPVVVLLPFLWLVLLGLCLFYAWPSFDVAMALMYLSMCTIFAIPLGLVLWLLESFLFGNDHGIWRGVVQTMYGGAIASILAGVYGGTERHANRYTGYRRRQSTDTVRWPYFATLGVGALVWIIALPYSGLI